ncbi:hypothetical protein D3C77_665410 [compost metagenome]
MTSDAVFSVKRCPDSTMLRAVLCRTWVKCVRLPVYRRAKASGVNRIIQKDVDGVRNGYPGREQGKASPARSTDI